MKSMDSFTLKRHDSFKIKVIENPHTVLLPELSDVAISSFKNQ